MSFRFSPNRCASNNCCTSGCYIGPPLYGPVSDYLFEMNEEPPPLCSIVGTNEETYFVPQTAAIVRSDPLTSGAMPEHFIERVGSWSIDGGLTSTDAGWRVITYDGDVSHVGVKPRSLRATFRINEAGGQAGFCVRWGGTAETSDYVIFQTAGDDPARILFAENDTIVAEITSGVTLPAVGVDYTVEVQRIKIEACDTAVDPPLDHYWHLRINDLEQAVTYLPDPLFRHCTIVYYDLDGTPFADPSDPVEEWGFVLGEETTDAVISSAHLLAEPRTIRTDWINTDATLETPAGKIWYPSEEFPAPSGSWKTTDSSNELISTSTSKDGTFRIQAEVRLCGYGSTAKLVCRDESSWTALVVTLVDSDTITLDLEGVTGTNGLTSLEFEPPPDFTFDTPFTIGLCLSLSKIRNHHSLEDHDSVRGVITSSTIPLKAVGVLGGYTVSSLEEVGFIDTAKNKWGLATGSVSSEVQFRFIRADLVDTTLIEFCFAVGETLICWPVERCPQCPPPPCSCCHDGTIPQQLLVQFTVPPNTDDRMWRLFGPSTPMPPPECGSCGVSFSHVLQYIGTQGDFPGVQACRWVGFTTQNMNVCVWNPETEEYDVHSLSFDLEWRAELFDIPAGGVSGCSALLVNVFGHAEDVILGGFGFQAIGSTYFKGDKNLSDFFTTAQPVDCRWLVSRDSDDNQNHEMFVPGFPSGFPPTHPGMTQTIDPINQCGPMVYSGAWDSPDTNPSVPNAADFADLANWEMTSELLVSPIDGGGAEPGSNPTKWIVAIRECGAGEEVEPFYIACVKAPPDDVAAIEINIVGIGPVCFQILDVYPGAICQDLPCEVPIFLDCQDFTPCECE